MNEDEALQAAALDWVGPLSLQLLSMDVAGLATSILIGKLWAITASPSWDTAMNHILNNGKTLIESR